MTKQFVKYVTRFLFDPLVVLLTLYVLNEQLGVPPGCRLVGLIAGIVGMAAFVVRIIVMNEVSPMVERVSLNLGYCAAILYAAGIVISFPVVDISASGRLGADGVFTAVRVLKSPGGEIDMAYQSDVFGLAHKPCLHCVDTCVIKPQAVTVPLTISLADGSVVALTGTASVEPSADIILLMDLCTRQKDPQKAMRNSAAEAIEECAKAITGWPAGTIEIDRRCQIKGRPFQFDSVAVELDEPDA